MSIRIDGVKFEKRSTRRGMIFLSTLAVLEVLFTFFLYLSLAGHIFAPEAAESAAGVPQLMSYQGRLTDSSGNPLGGAGTTYCFRYSLYDAVSSGNKLWPAATPATSTATVIDGIFSDQIGRVETLTYDFISTSTIYLQVDAYTATSTCTGGLWESLAPRQQIVASGFALTAESVYGDLLRTTTSTKVQFGTGGGVTSGQTLLSLDVKNVADSLGGACTDNGALWYNSANTRALICENNTIKPLSNSSTTIAGIGVNAVAPVTAGNVVFSNSNNVTFGLDGSTVTATATFAGGGVTLSQWEPYILATSTSVSSLAPASIWFNTINLPQAVAISKVNLVKSFNMSVASATSVASTGTQAYTYSQGFSIFKRQDYAANSTNLTIVTTASVGMTFQYLYSSTSQSLNVSWVTNSTGGTSAWASTSNASNLVSYWTGLKYLPVPLVTTLTAGEYWIGHRHSSTAGATASNVTAAFISNLQVTFPAMSMGQFGFAGNRSLHPGKQGHGYASAFTTNNTMAMTVISTNSQQFPYFNFVNF